MSKRLNAADLAEIETALCNCLEAEGDFGAGGEHYILMATLKKFGINVNGRDDAKRVAERVVSNGRY